MFVAAGLLLAGVVLGVLYLWSPHVTLRITTGPGGNLATRFISAMIAETEKKHPRINFETVTVPDLRASSKALEDHKVNVALVRSDIAPPSNGNTLVILRRDAIAVILPAASKIDSVSQLSGKTVAIPAGLLQEENSAAFDLILNYFNIRPDAVKRRFVPMKDIGAEIHHERVAAVVAVGPVGPGEVVDAVAAIARATGGAPKILEFDDNDAIAARFPGLESIDIPEGAFRARPPTPDDSTSGVAVSYRLVVPDTMLNVVAGALGRSVINAKGRLMTLTPQAGQIEAPDPSQTSAILPVHPGFANYLNNGDQSFFDEARPILCGRILLLRDRFRRHRQPRHEPEDGAPTGETLAPADDRRRSRERRPRAHR